MRKTQTRRALLTSVLALVLCVAMLASSTYAWFTDSATVSVNKIQSGKLDIQLLDENDQSIEGKTLAFKDADDNNLWEPGCTYELQPITIKNAGNLACKYEVVITGINGDAKLNEAIEWTITDSGNPNLFKPGDISTVQITGHMKEDAGDEYQDLTIDGIAITVVATQVPFEKDSVDENYDKDATAASKWDGTAADAAGLAENTNETAKTVEIKTAAQFKAFADAVNAGNSYKDYTVKLMTPVDLAGEAWAPIGATNGATMDSYPSYTFAGTFDGNGLTISNLKVETEGKNAVAGLFGSANRATIKNVVIDGADIKSEHYAGGILAYETEYTNVIGCTVKNATIVSSTNGTGDNGDKVGGIVGAMTGANAAYAVSGNTVENCTIIAYRDAAGIIGFAADGLIVKENTVINTTVAQDNSDNYKNAEQTTFGAIVGRGAPALSNNTEQGNNIAGKAAAAADAAEFNATLADEDVTVINLGTGNFAMNGANSSNPVTGKTIIGDGETTLDSVNGFADCTFKNVVVNDIYTLNGNTMIDCEIVAPVGDVACATRLLDDAKFVGCTFTANGAGTSLWLDDVSANTSVTFENCTFVDNIRLGGKATNHYTFKNCEFKGGTVNWAKALVITYSPATFENCTFTIEEPALYGVRLAQNMTAADITFINTTTPIMVP